MSRCYYAEFKKMMRNAAKKRKYLEQFNLRDEGKGYGYSAVLEDGRRVYAIDIEQLYNKIHG